MNAPGPSPDPGEPTRGGALLVRVDNLFARLDGWLGRVLPAGSDPLAQAGRMANLALLAAVASGVALLIWYSSSLHQAYSSLDALRGRTPGGWVRALHRYSSDLAMLFVGVHAMRMFFARKFAGARWLPWVSGIGLVGVIWFIGWTGFWLVWDRPAQEIAATSMRFLDALPVFGEPLSRLFLADRLVPSLLFFVVFFLHMLLPLAIAIGLAVHLTRLNRVRLLPDRRLALSFLVMLAAASWLVPAPLDAPARMAEKAAHLTVDAWYLTPLALALRFREAGLWLALGGTALLGAAVPWLLGRRHAPRTDASGVRPSADFQTVVEIPRCHACTQCMQDCPFDAIQMVPRTDGKRLSYQAWVDPTRCVGCAVCVGSCDSEAMHLPWFDVPDAEPRIQASVEAALARGEAARVALVGMDCVGGSGYFDAALWRGRLPGFLVHAVPTASWVRPKFVERLLAAGAQGILIVRDARAEAAARDGNRWILERLQGTRAPSFRPARAGAGAENWRVVDFDPTDPGRLRAAALAFSGGPTTVSAAVSGWTPARCLALAACLAFILTAAIAPSHLRVDNPESPEPELVFSFKAFGAHETAGATVRDETNVPVHMRGAPTGKPRRAAIRVRLTVDGVTEERAYAAKGISHDGPAIDVWRRPLTPGTHAVTIEVLNGETGSPLQWSGVVEARSRHVQVLTYDPSTGFRIE
ncbi:MAG TPA: cytochrome b N-terminal domain-containing protein [Opitutaceae bacterium]